MTRALWVYSRCLSHTPGPCIRAGPPGLVKEPDQVGGHTGRLTPLPGPWHSLTTPHHSHTSPGPQVRKPGPREMRPRPHCHWFPGRVLGSLLSSPSSLATGTCGGLGHSWALGPADQARPWKLPMLEEAEEGTARGILFRGRCRGDLRLLGQAPPPRLGNAHRCPLDTAGAGCCSCHLPSHGCTQATFTHLAPSVYPATQGLTPKPPGPGCPLAGWLGTPSSPTFPVAANPAMTLGLGTTTHPTAPLNPQRRQRHHQPQCFPQNRETGAHGDKDPGGRVLFGEQDGGRPSGLGSCRVIIASSRKAL